MKTVICGAGIAGLSLAGRLAALGWDVLVVDRATGPREHGYMIDFWGLGYDAAERVGILPRLQEFSYPVTEWTYVDEHGHRRAGLDQSGFARAQRGRLLTVLRPQIEQAVREKLGEHVELRYSTTIDGLDDLDDAVRVRLSDGTLLEADLVVGADGIHSKVRDLLFGEEQRFLRHLGFHMAAWVFDDPEIHGLLGSRFCFTDTYDQQMGFYGLRDGRVATFAVHRSTDPAMPEDPQRAIRATYSSLGWVVPRALEQCPASEHVYYDQMVQVDLPTWTRGRVALLGDACAAVSPLASQGASLAMAGAYLLARQLETADDIGSALTAYQRRWQPIVTRHQRSARRGAQWFLPESPLRLRMRRAAVRLTSLPGVSGLVSAALGGNFGPGIERLSTDPQHARPAG